MMHCFCFCYWASWNQGLLWIEGGSDTGAQHIAVNILGEMSNDLWGRLLISDLLFCMEPSF